MAFEETTDELTQNVRSLGFDLDVLARRKKISMDHVRIERSEIEETGEYDLEGLFVRLAYAIDGIGAKRVVLDTIETVFGGFTNEGILRSELRRLFRWLNDRGVTAVVTGERGDGQMTRHGLEEYVSDCVILLDHRVIEQVSTRRLRVVKYRGTTHGTNEYPFLIDEDGINVLPVTSVGLEHAASNERISSGVDRLDRMLDGKGYYRGSSILVSGTAGSGKTSMAAHFADAASRRGEKSLYFAFEESEAQIIRNMRSIGLNLQTHVNKGLLKFHTVRSTMHGLEMHLVMFHKLIREFQPENVIIDPMSNLLQAGSQKDANSTMVRLIDFLKGKGITAFLVNLTSADRPLEKTEVDISSLVDTWLLLRDIELGGERNRALYILKSRGMPHSNQIREFLLTDRGIDLQDVYVGLEGVLTGSMRKAQEAREEAAALQRRQEVESRQRELARKREALDARIAALRKEFEEEEDTVRRLIDQDREREAMLKKEREQMAASRHADNRPALMPSSGSRAKRGGKS